METFGIKITLPTPKKNVSDRSLILEEMIPFIHEEVKAKPYYINAKGKKVKNQDYDIIKLNNELRDFDVNTLRYIHSISKDYKTRGGSYLRCMRGCKKNK